MSSLKQESSLASLLTESENIVRSQIQSSLKETVEIVFQIGRLEEEISDLKDQLNTLRETVPPELSQILSQLPHESVQRLASEFYWLDENLAGLIRKAYALTLRGGFNPEPSSVIIRCYQCKQHIEVTVSSWAGSHQKHSCEECRRKRREWEKQWAPDGSRKLYPEEIADDDSVVENLRTLPYKEYLQTEHWKRLRSLALKQAHYRCQLCYSNQQQLDTHHRTYKRRGCELLSDLIVLCNPCHSRHHGYLPKWSDE